MKSASLRRFAAPAAALLTLSLAACAAPSSTPDAAPSSSTGIPAEYQRLVLVGASQGGALYNWVVAVSQLLNTELGMETSVQAGATQANALDLESGVIQFGTTSPGDLVQVAGDASVLDATELRTLWAAFSTPFHVMVAKDAGIDSIEDLAGRSIATGVAGSIESLVATTTLQCAGVDPAKVNIQNIGKTEGGAAFSDGSIDAWTGLGTTPTAAFMEAVESQRGAKLLPLEDDVRACVADEFAGLEEAVIPAGSYVGQDADIPTLSQWFYAVVPSSMPEGVVELIAQTIAEHHDELVRSLPAAADSTAENTAEFPGFELHPGTAKVLAGLGIEVR